MELWLTWADAASPLLANIDLRRVLGPEISATEAKKILDALHRTREPQLLAEGPREEILDMGHRAADAQHINTEIDLSPQAREAVKFANEAEGGAVAEHPAKPDVPRNVVNVALLLLMCTNGNLAGAVLHARLMTKHAPTPEFYDEVAETLLAVLSEPPDGVEVNFDDGA